MSEVIDDDGRKRQQESLAQLDLAVAEFRTADALGALYTSDMLAGLKARLRARWPSLREEEDVHYVVSRAVDAFADELEKRKLVTDPLGFIWIVIERRASDEVRRRRRERPTDPHVMAGRILPVLPVDPGPAIQEARRLLPRIRGEKIRGALELILNAMDEGRQRLPCREIAEALDVSDVYARQLRGRAFDRLLVLAREEQAVGRGFDLPELWDDDEDILVAPDGGDENDD